jgi:hypothetical protein
MGGIRLIEALKGKLGDDMNSPAAEALRQVDATTLAKQLELYHPDAAPDLQNLRIPDGSSLELDHDGALVLTMKDGQPVTLIDAKGYIVKHPEGLGKYIGVHHAVEHVQHAAAAHTEQAAAGHESDAPNDAELKDLRSGHPHARTPVTGAPIEGSVRGSAAPAPENYPTPKPRPSVAEAHAAPQPEPAARPSTPESAAPRPIVAPETAQTAPNIPADAPQFPTNVPAYDSLFGTRVDPQVMHIYHRPDGSLMAYGGSSAQQLRDFAANYAVQHDATVTVDASYSLEGETVERGMQFSKSLTGGSSATFVDEVPDPHYADRVVE